MLNRFDYEIIAILYRFLLVDDVFEFRCKTSRTRSIYCAPLVVILSIASGIKKTDLIEYEQRVWSRTNVAGKKRLRVKFCNRVSDESTKPTVEIERTDGKIRRTSCYFSTAPKERLISWWNKTRIGIK